MSDKLEINLEFHGPLATHNYPCPIYHDSQKAVFVCHEGRFDTSWVAQKDGWHIIRARGWFKKMIFNFVFKQ